MKDRFMDISDIFTAMWKSSETHFIKTLQIKLDKLRTDPEYLSGAAAFDFYSEIDFDEISMIKVDSKDLSDDIKALDMLIKFLMSEVRDGEAALLAKCSQRRFGHVKAAMINPVKNLIVSGLLQNAIASEGRLRGLLCTRVVAIQPDAMILNGDGYTQKQVELLCTIKSRNLLISKGSPSLKRQLISNDLSI